MFKNYHDFQTALSSVSLIISVELTDVYAYRRFSFPKNERLSSPDFSRWSSDSFIVLYSSELSMVVFVLKGLLITESNISPLAIAYRHFVNLVKVDDEDDCMKQQYSEYLRDINGHNHMNEDTHKTQHMQTDNLTSGLDFTLNTDFHSLTYTILQDIFEYHIYILKPQTVLFEHLVQFCIQYGVKICGYELVLKSDEFRKVFIDYVPTNDNEMND